MLRYLSFILHTDLLACKLIYLVRDISYRFFLTFYSIWYFQHQSFSQLLDQDRAWKPDVLAFILVHMDLPKTVTAAKLADAVSGKILIFNTNYNTTNHHLKIWKTSTHHIPKHSWMFTESNSQHLKLTDLSNKSNYFLTKYTTSQTGGVINFWLKWNWFDDFPFRSCTNRQVCSTPYLQQMVSFW